MGIFSKKNIEPTDSDDLAKAVEEYNLKFLASQEPQKAEASQAKPSTHVSQGSKSAAGTFDEEGFRVVSEENMNYAYGHMHRFVETIVSEKAKAIILTCFDGDRPSPTAFRAASQFFNLSFNKIWNSDTYSLDDMKYDMDKLCAFINAQNDLGMFAFMMGYSKYIVQEIKMNLKKTDLTDDQLSEVTADIERARDKIFEITEKKMY